MLCVATCRLWHLLLCISLKGHSGANQNRERILVTLAFAIPGVCCLVEVLELPLAPSIYPLT